MIRILYFGIPYLIQPLERYNLQMRLLLLPFVSECKMFSFGYPSPCKGTFFQHVLGTQQPTCPFSAQGNQKWLENCCFPDPYVGCAHFCLLGTWHVALPAGFVRLFRLVELVRINLHFRNDEAGRWAGGTQKVCGVVGRKGAA